MHTWGRSHQRLSVEALPAEGLSRIGQVIHVGLDGPGLLRPGDRTDPSAVSFRSVAELTVVTAGELEFRDSLGNRGVLTTGQVRLLSGGAGVVSEIGPSRAMRRDGGDHQTLTVRWLQPGQPVVPTVRMAEEIPSAGQGRSTIATLVGADGAVAAPGGIHVWAAEVAPGATVDLPIPPQRVAGIVVRRGAVLAGEALTSVEGPATALFTPSGSDPQRLTLATQLEGDDGASVVVLVSPAMDTPMVHQHTVLAAGDAEELAGVVENARTPGFGPLPRLDG
ncbi:pirin family protein [Euzebya tangerina]|uniref:pirin family protein n=1 Tax=Euzebya tangerina TaxID=591198 RepID=UPI0013C2DCEA|nr:pirin family protein [Euzebya tangerina]